MTNTWKRVLVTLSFIGLLSSAFAQAVVPIEVAEVEGGRLEIRETDATVGEGAPPASLAIKDQLTKQGKSYELKKDLFYAVVVRPNPGFAIESIVWSNTPEHPKGPRELKLQNYKTVEGVFLYTFSLIGFTATTPVTQSKLTPKFKKSEVVVKMQAPKVDEGTMKVHSVVSGSDPKELASGDVVGQNSFLLVEVISNDKKKRPVVTSTIENSEKKVAMRPVQTQTGVVWQGQIQVGDKNVSLKTTFVPDNLRVNFTAPTAKKGDLVVKAGEEKLSGSKSILRNTKLSFSVKSADPAKEPHLFYLFEKEKLDGAEGGTNERQELTLTKQSDGTYTGELELKYAVTITVRFGEDEKDTPVEEAQLGRVSVYPNPFEGQFCIRDEAGQAAQYQLFSLQGQLLQAGRIEGAQTNVETEELPLGIYLLRLKSATGECKTIRVVKR